MDVMEITVPTVHRILMLLFARLPSVLCMYLAVQWFFNCLFSIMNTYDFLLS